MYGGGGVHNEAGTLTLTDSTISGNQALNWWEGGGIRNWGTVTLIDSTVSGNSASEGGGIANRGTMVLTNSTVSGNSMGGIYNRGGTATLTSSTVNDNYIGIDNRGTMELTNSTVSGNDGGIYNLYGTVTLTNSTVNDNSEGGILNYSGTATLINTIVANNPWGGDCGGDLVTSLGHNLDSDGTCNLTATGDIPNTNPLLGPLQDNGGPTETHALLPGSPAIDAGDDSACPATDQRGVIRPLDGDVDGTATCDMGAYEALALEVDIDIKPGSYPNCFNVDGNGVIPVAILGSADFDVNQIDPSTLSFGGLDVAVRGRDRLQCSYEDVSGDFTYPEGAPDGYLDMVCQFADDPTLWVPGDGTAMLTGNLLADYGGLPISGSDEICIRPE
jgi:hypothetical protein